MNIHEFFRAHEDRSVRPVMKLKQDLTVDTYVWIVGNTPYQMKKRITIPAGTRIIRAEYSNFGDGYSMTWEKAPRSMGRHYRSRWFRVAYSDMEVA